MTIQDWLGTTNEVGTNVWENKYRDNETFDEWLWRVSGGNPKVMQLIVEQKFLPAGRILAGRGKFSAERKVSVSNCYVTPPPEDCIESIYTCAMQMARTYSYGGGCGVDISKLAPKGARIRNAAKSTTGAVSFMELFAMTTSLIGQKGRRGALMISMDSDHPDLEEFIDIKQDLSKITSANISIRAKDNFLQAAKDGKMHTLRYEREATGEVIEKQVDAKAILRRIAKNNWDMGEPGFLFWDNITKWNLLSEDPNHSYAGVNPCAEEPLPANGACLLGSLNLGAFVITENEEPQFDYAGFAEAVETGVQALNDILDEGIPAHPLEEQRIQAAQWRQIGLGVFGLADMLIKMEMVYGGDESLALCRRISRLMVNQALRTSALLAQKDGPYPRYNAKAVLASPFLEANAEPGTIELIQKHGLRNSQLLTIPPTGTISTMLGTSSGIEPIFDITFTIKTESVHGEPVYYDAYTPLIDRYMKEHGITRQEDLPDYILDSTANKLDYMRRIRMQAVWQQAIDASISSTVNLPETATVEDVERVYFEAWEHGCKGITVFRNGCKRAAVLTSGKKKELNRCKTELVRMGCGTLQIDCYNNEKGICKIVASPIGKGGCRAQTEAISKLTSLALSSGADIADVIAQIKAIPCPSCQRRSDISVTSCPDAIAQVLESLMNGTEIKQASPDGAISDAENDNNSVCPLCGTPYTFEGGCQTCPACGYSHCGG